MEEIILNKMKKDYDTEIKEVNKVLHAKNRIEELKYNEAVREYLELTSLLADYQNIKLLSEEEILYRIFLRNIVAIKKTNKIYVYLGTFIESNDADNDMKTGRDNFDANYSLYADLENDHNIVVNIDDREEFENTHQIIFLEGIDCDIKSFYELQRKFISDCIKTDQETAIRKLTN